MRVTSGLFVAALIRRAFSAGAFAAVTARGAEEAGAIFVVIDRLDGTLDLYGPAPQAVFEDRPSDRLFTRLKERVSSADIGAALTRERRFDPDLWTLTIEDREGRAFVEVVK